MSLQIKRLRVENLRRFRQPFELTDLAPGLNLFTGPNEAGKSTLVAAIRAAFFERARSTTVNGLQPWDAPAASPDIEIDFSVDGTDYRLHKRFLKGNLCELRIGPESFTADGAETRLADLLGFSYAAKGLSRAEHQGVPGLLWITQGEGQEVNAAVGHASDYLREALTHSAGEVASSHGDALIEQVRGAREVLVTQAGKPRDQFALAVQQRDDALLHLGELDQQIASYRTQVDELARLRAEHQIDERERPWVALHEQAQAAREALARVDKVRAECDERRRSLASLQAHADLLERTLAAAARDLEQLTLRRDALGQAESALAALSAAGTDPEGRVRALEADEARARAALEASRGVQARVDLLARQVEADQQLAALTQAHASALAQQAEVEAQRLLVGQARIDPTEREALRAEHDALTGLKLRQEAVATRLRFSLSPEAGIELDGDAVTGECERLLTVSAMLVIPGHGSVEIVPGGEDLATLATDTAHLAARHRERLQRLGLADLAEAERRDMEADRAQRALDLAAGLLKNLAPRGLEALREAMIEAQGRTQGLAARLAGLPPVATDTPMPTVTEAEHLVRQAEAQHEQALAALHLGRQALERARSDRALAELAVDTARREVEQLQGALSNPDHQAEQARWRDERAATAASVERMQTAIAELERAVAEAQPEQLRLDAERLGRSARQAEASWQARVERIATLQGALQNAGAQGLEETRAETALKAEAASRRCIEFARRADALTLLLDLLETRRSERVRRLQAPLQQRIDYYLGVAFPGASLAIGEDLTPATLTRTATHGPLPGAVQDLSFGAREQMGLISRLAYADLLREAGRPTLIILDDALVHSDTERLEQMKRVLFDAAQRHQVLLFTCHPQRWRNSGAVERAIG
jgi:hypothetical protein